MGLRLVKSFLFCFSQMNVYVISCLTIVFFSYFDGKQNQLRFLWTNEQPQIILIRFSSVNALRVLLLNSTKSWYRNFLQCFRYYLPQETKSLQITKHAYFNWLRPYCYCPYLFHWIDWFMYPWELYAMANVDTCLGSPSIWFWERYSQTFAFISQAFCAGLHY